MANRNKLTARIEIRAAETLPDALAVAADKHMTTVSGYARQAIINQLRADGIDPLAMHCEAA